MALNLCEQSFTCSKFYGRGTASGTIFIIRILIVFIKSTERPTIFVHYESPPLLVIEY